MADALVDVAQGAGQPHARLEIRRNATDKPHPAKTSEEIAALASNIEVQKDWKAPSSSR